MADPFLSSMTAQSPWVQQLAGSYASGEAQMFVLHGNVGDLVRVEEKGKISYVMLTDFLSSQLFGTWDAVIAYDQATGPRPIASSPARLERMRDAIERTMGPLEALRALREPSRALPAIDSLLEHALLSSSGEEAIAIILDYAPFLAPNADTAFASREQASHLAMLLNWARSPYFKRRPFAFCLIAERMEDLHPLIVRHPQVVRVEIPHPDVAARLEFLQWIAGDRPFGGLCECTMPELAELTAGLTLSHLQGLLQRPLRTGVTLKLGDLKRAKKQLLEGQCQGLIDFVEPAYGLELVSGHAAAKGRLEQDAKLIRSGKLEAVPMGYLICGPVGTGKTFLAECYAGSVGIPCVKLRNFRSKYVGETEGNLERILRVLRAMGPVAVIIDEADAMLGDREAEGDSGTSSRVFGQFASQMGDTAWRGKLIWFLLTCRPDLLPIDLKRQGRCEVHIPLFYPEGEDELCQSFLAMGRKCKIPLAAGDLPAIPKGMVLSVADIEGILLRARRKALLEGREAPGKEDLAEALARFVPSPEGDEKELQTIAAVLECTESEFLPERWKKERSSPEKRHQLLQRYRELKVATS